MRDANDVVSALFGWSCGKGRNNLNVTCGKGRNHRGEEAVPQNRINKSSSTNPLPPAAASRALKALWIAFRRSVLALPNCSPALLLKALRPSKEARILISLRGRSNPTCRSRSRNAMQRRRQWPCCSRQKPRRGLVGAGRGEPTRGLWRGRETGAASSRWPRMIRRRRLRFGRRRRRGA